MSESMIMGEVGAAMTRDGLLRQSPGVKEPGRQKFVSVTADLMQALTYAASEKAREIRSDRGLNSRGENEALGELLDQTTASLDEILESQTVIDYEKRAEFVESRLRKPFAMLKGKDVPGSTQAADLLRDTLREQDGDVTVANILRRAAAEGEVAVLGAVINAPAAYPFATPELMAELETTYQELLWPAEVAELRDLAATMDTLRHNRDAARNAAAKSFGLSILR